MYYAIYVKKEKRTKKKTKKRKIEGLGVLVKERRAEWKRDITWCTCVAVVSGCSEDEAAGVVNVEVGGGCAAGAPTTGSGVGGGSGTGSEAGGGGGGGGGAGTGTGGGGGGVRGGGGSGGGEGGSTKQGGEKCPQCGFLCRDVHVLQLHLEDTHKTPYAIDKNDLNAQFPQVVSETNVKDERTPLFLVYY